MKDVIDRYRSNNTHKQRLHHHGEAEILLFTEGKGVFHTEQRDYRFKAGCAIIVPSGMKHISKSEEEFVSITVRDVGNKRIMTETPIVLKDNEEGEGRALAEKLLEAAGGAAACRPGKKT